MEPLANPEKYERQLFFVQLETRSDEQSMPEKPPR
jgi:hypothetical protein